MKRCFWRKVCAVLYLGLSCILAWADGEWKTYQDDDETMDSNWGVFFQGVVVRKILILDKVEGAKDAVIQYQVGSNPYNLAKKEAYGKPVEGVVWNDICITVNGKEAVKGSPLELGTEGWHKVRIDPKLLKTGENTVDFSWVNGGSPEGYGYIYIGIDTGDTGKKRSVSSVDGRNFTSDCLRPGNPPSPKWQGEYMIRLMLAF